MEFSINGARSTVYSQRKKDEWALFHTISKINSKAFYHSKSWMIKQKIEKFDYIKILRKNLNFCMAKKNKQSLKIKSTHEKLGKYTYNISQIKG